MQINVFERFDRGVSLPDLAASSINLGICPFRSAACHKFSVVEENSVVGRRVQAESGCTFLPFTH